jgi:hypothetical protein
MTDPVEKVETGRKTSQGACPPRATKEPERRKLVRRTSGSLTIKRREENGHRTYQVDGNGRTGGRVLNLRCENVEISII